MRRQSRLLVRLVEGIRRSTIVRCHFWGRSLVLWLNLAVHFQCDQSFNAELSQFISLLISACRVCNQTPDRVLHSRCTIEDICSTTAREVSCEKGPSERPRLRESISEWTFTRASSVGDPFWFIIRHWFIVILQREVSVPDLDTAMSVKQRSSLVLLKKMSGCLGRIAATMR